MASGTRHSSAAIARSLKVILILFTSFLLLPLPFGLVSFFLCQPSGGITHPASICQSAGCSQPVACIQLGKLFKAVDLYNIRLFTGANFHPVVLLF